MTNFMLTGGTEGGSAASTFQTIKTAASFVPVVGNIVNIGTSLAGVVGIKTSKDPARFEANQRAYEQAIRDPTSPFMNKEGGYAAENALAFLLMKSPTMYGGMGGWATDKAEQDAWQKYQQAVAVLKANNGPKPGSSPLASFNLASATGNQYAVVGLIILAMLFVVKKGK